MKKVMIGLVVKILQVIYLVFRPLSLKNKVTIISRQADEPTLDIRLLNECLNENKIETVVITKTLKKSIAGIIEYSFSMLHQMYHISTSKVIVVDGYCILVSVLPKKEQKVIQMWHALGAIKKFGWQNTESPDGHTKEVAEAMNMHGNYDYVLAPGNITGKIFAKAFRVSEDQIVLLGLPRIDFIRTEDVGKRREIETAYPQIMNKINVLYVPTFRKNAALELEKLVREFDFHKYNFIIKKHFLDKGDYSWAEVEGAIVDSRFSSMEWLRVSDKIVTDYSAMAFEAAIADKEIYIYQPDVNDYNYNVGLNIELAKEAIGKYVCESEQEFFGKLDMSYEKECVREFLGKFIEIHLDNCTQELCDFIAGLLAE